MDLFWYCLLTSIALCSMCSALECWKCIADDCDMDPAHNYKASKMKCLPGESCQKVIYRGRDKMSNRDYNSITRSCSQQECIPKADNCSEQLLTNPGCMSRFCCEFNLCNGAASGPAPLRALVLSVLLYVCLK